MLLPAQAAQMVKAEKAVMVLPAAQLAQPAQGRLPAVQVMPPGLSVINLPRALSRIFVMLAVMLLPEVE
jgi:hypothetical protein